MTSAHALSCPQQQMLLGVSRSFALTIPQLPAGLRSVVTNAYLLCRIADTIEDDTQLSPKSKLEFHEMLMDILAGRADGSAFARRLHPRLAASTSSAERELIRRAADVARDTRGFSTQTRRILQHRIGIMCHGMRSFQSRVKSSGLRDMAALNEYCYYVAGVVGEMLTELFSDYATDIRARHQVLLPKALSFGQGLQMTNILKDGWEDLKRGVCWLPRETFSAAGYDLEVLAPHHQRAVFARGLKEMIAVTHGHLRHALDYSLLIPARHRGVRRFCLWSLGLALLTLQKIHRRPGFTSARQVKVRRKTVYASLAVTDLASRSDVLLRALFGLFATGLPLATRVSVHCGAPDTRATAASGFHAGPHPGREPVSAAGAESRLS